MHEHAKPRTGAIALWAAILAITVTGPAAAQLYPGDDVQVNPNAAPRVLLEPDGRHTRVLPVLRQPGADGPIHLHRPVPHRHVARRTEPSTAVAIETTTAPPPAATTPASAPPPAAPKPAASRKTAVASNPPSAAPATTGNDFSYGWEPSVPAAHPESKKPAPKAAQPARVASQPPKAPPPPKPEPARPARTETASAQSPAPPGDNSFSFETPEIPSATSPPPPAAAPVAAKPKAKAPPQPAPQKPQAQFASTEPPPLETIHHEKIGKPEKKGDDHKGLAKQGEVLFAGGSSDPQAASYQQIKSLASDLNGALDSGSGRVEVDAYGGHPGDKSSDARRLSLRRALTVRQLLIDNGVPSDRIDVRALGGAVDGTPDRVDVFVKA